MTEARILVCDSGSTKADWMMCDAGGERTLRTKGINPVRDTKDDIYNTLSELPAWKPDRVFFYGAGCMPPYSGTLKDCLQGIFPDATVHVDSDLIGAVHALFGKEEGIACILGTGSGSCLCRRGKPVRQVPSLGYILGDEGSGAVLGKRLVGDVLKSQLPEELKEEFLSTFSLSQQDIIDKVYRQPAANRFLASLCPFLLNHRDRPEIRQLIENEFERFVRRNVMMYERPDLEVRYVGGISVHFEPELRRVHTRLGLKMGCADGAPIKKMAEFHRKNDFWP